jgi:hypothetical protein
MQPIISLQSPYNHTFAVWTTNWAIAHQMPNPFYTALCYLLAIESYGSYFRAPIISSHTLQPPYNHNFTILATNRQSPTCRPPNSQLFLHCTMSSPCHWILWIAPQSFHYIQLCCCNHPTITCFHYLGNKWAITHFLPTQFPALFTLHYIISLSLNLMDHLRAPITLLQPPYNHMFSLSWQQMGNHPLVAHPTPSPFYTALCHLLVIESYGSPQNSHYIVATIL